MQKTFNFLAKFNLKTVLEETDVKQMYFIMVFTIGPTFLFIQ